MDLVPKLRDSSKLEARTWHRNLIIQIFPFKSAVKIDTDEKYIKDIFKAIYLIIKALRGRRDFALRAERRWRGAN